MKIYFDESYPQDQGCIIMGALILDDYQDSIFSKKFIEIKRHHTITNKLKYNDISTGRELQGAKQAIRFFNRSSTAIFRAVIVPHSETKLKVVPGKSLAEKREYVYSDSATKLILNNIPRSEKVDIFMDKEERMLRRNFYTKLSTVRAPLDSTINSVSAVDSKNNATTSATSQVN